MWRAGLCAALVLGGCIATHDFGDYVEVDDDAGTTSQGGNASAGGGTVSNGGSANGGSANGGSANGGAGVGGSGPMLCTSDLEDGLLVDLDFCGSSIRYEDVTIDVGDVDSFTAFGFFDSSCPLIVVGSDNPNPNISYELQVMCGEGQDAYVPFFFCGSGSTDLGQSCIAYGSSVGIEPACGVEGERLSVSLIVNGEPDLATCEDYAFDFIVGGCIGDFDCANGEMCCPDQACRSSC